MSEAKTHRYSRWVTEFDGGKASGAFQQYADDPDGPWFGGPPSSRDWCICGHRRNRHDEEGLESCMAEACDCVSFCRDSQRPIEQIHPHEHVYRCQDCGEIGSQYQEGYADGYRTGRDHQPPSTTSAEAEPDPRDTPRGVSVDEAGWRGVAAHLYRQLKWQATCDSGCSCSDGLALRRFEEAADGPGVDELAEAARREMQTVTRIYDVPRGPVVPDAGTEPPVYQPTHECAAGHRFTRIWGYPACPIVGCGEVGRPLRKATDDVAHVSGRVGKVIDAMYEHFGVEDDWSKWRDAEPTQVVEFILETDRRLNPAAPSAVAEWEELAHRAKLIVRYAAQAGGSGSAGNAARAWLERYERALRSATSQGDSA